jgi:hypothetical protein
VYLHFRKRDSGRQAGGRIRMKSDSCFIRLGKRGFIRLGKRGFIRLGKEVS